MHEEPQKVVDPSTYQDIELPKTKNEFVRPENASLILKVTTLMILIHTTSFAMIATAIPPFILNIYEGDTAKAAEEAGIIVGVSSGLRFFSNPIWGALSDSFGRKLFLLLSMCIHGIVWVLLGAFPKTSVLFITMTLTAVADCTYSIGFAIVGDVSGSGEGGKETTHDFGLLGCAFGIGLIVGPIAAGLLNTIGPDLPFFVAACLIISGAAIGTAFLPESLTPHRHHEFTCSRATPWPSLHVVMARKEVAFVASILFLHDVANATHQIWFMYTNYAYGWDMMKNAMFLCIAGAVIAMFQGILIRYIIPGLVTEPNAVIFALLSQCAAYLIIGVSRKEWMIYCSIIFIGIQSIARPASYSIATTFVDRRDQGSLQGALGSIQTLAMFCGGPLFSYLFVVSISDNMKQELPASCPSGYKPSGKFSSTSEAHNCGGFPGFSFICASFLLLLNVFFAFGVFYFFARKTKDATTAIVNIKDSDPLLK